ncbi:MAG: nodulation protein NfeD [Acidobacteria bacterium]|nr:nodulation protein NfeD [Acidobacteriota bacterium]
MTILWALLAAVTVAAAVASGQTGPSPRAGSPLVIAADVDALIHPVSAEYMVDAMDRADAEGAALVVFTLRTPGGLVESTRTIVSRMIASKTPVVVFVAPAGAHAASAGFIIVIAADVAVMAPGTNIGAAHPVSGTGEKMDETMSRKSAEDLAAYARNLASKRGRNEALCDQAVKESRAFTDGEALKASPPLIDFVAPDLPDLLRQIDGRTITRFDGRTVIVRTSGARVVALEMSLRQRILSALAHPNIAYLLLSLGMLGLTIELWNPGSVLPGVVGGICLLLAFFTFQVLPVNYAGLLLILFGIALLVLEIKVTSYGLLSAGGVISLLFGSMILMDSSAPELQVSLQVILPVVLGLSAILIFLVRLAVGSQRRRPITGTSGMIDEAGVALTAIPAGGIGRVATHGEIWRATSGNPLAAGDPVRVTAVNGLMLTVRRDPAGATPEPPTAA